MEKMRNDVKKMNSIKRTFAVALVAAVMLMTAGVLHQATAQKLSPSTKMKNKFAQQSNSKPDASAAFSGARDLIDDAQWAKAEQAFNQYLSAYTKEDNLDAAMYWMAYAQ